MESTKCSGVCFKSSSNWVKLPSGIKFTSSLNIVNRQRFMKWAVRPTSNPASSNDLASSASLVLTSRVTSAAYLLSSSA